MSGDDLLEQLLILKRKQQQLKANYQKRRKLDSQNKNVVEDPLAIDDQQQTHLLVKKAVIQCLLSSELNPPIDTNSFLKLLQTSHPFEFSLIENEGSNVIDDILDEFNTEELLKTERVVLTRTIKTVILATFRPRLLSSLYNLNKKITLQPEQIYQSSSSVEVQQQLAHHRAALFDNSNANNSVDLVGKSISICEYRIF